MSEDFNPRANVRKLPGRGGPAEYLDVKERLRWFRHEHPDGWITTEHVTLTDQIAVFKATAKFYTDGGGVGTATGYGSETPGDFKDYIEKAETKAIGRALANLGYGTQFLPDDGDRIADAPVERAQPQPRNAPVAPSEPPESIKPAPRTNTIPKDAEMAQPSLPGASSTDTDWLTKIGDVTDVRGLQELNAELTKAGASRAVWDAYGKKAKAINSTT